MVTATKLCKMWVSPLFKGTDPLPSLSGPPSLFKWTPSLFKWTPFPL